MRRLCSLATVVALVAGCDRDQLGPTPRFDSAAFAVPDASGGPGITVMTYNVYYGTDPSPLLTAPLDQVPFVAADVWAKVIQTDFPARAGAL